MEKLKNNGKETFRKIDELGRIIIPIESRKKLQIKPGDKLDIYKSGTNIILKKAKFDIINSSCKELHMLLDNTYEIRIQISSIKPIVSDRKSADHIIRTIDELGRVVIPIDIRHILNIKEKDEMKICVKDNMMILIKRRDDKYFGKKSHSYNNKRKREYCLAN